jgi:hypothetical protein
MRSGGVKDSAKWRIKKGSRVEEKRIQQRGEQRKDEEWRRKGFREGEDKERMRSGGGKDSGKGRIKKGSRVEEERIQGRGEQRKDSGKGKTKKGFREGENKERMRSGKGKGADWRGQMGKKRRKAQCIVGW